uniref:Putative 39s ribosomal protein l39 n=1 Tax=Ixodes ricinus TaxID=34613 RepID=A0A0K8RH07_IXORI
MRQLPVSRNGDLLPSVFSPSQTARQVHPGTIKNAAKCITLRTFLGNNYALAHLNPLLTKDGCHPCHPIQTIKSDHKCDSRFSFGVVLARSLADGKTPLLFYVPCVVCSFVLLFVEERKLHLAKKKKSSCLRAFTLKQHGFDAEVRFSRQRYMKPSFLKRINAQECVTK